MEVIGLDIGISYIKAVSIENAEKPKLLKYAAISAKGISAKLYSEAKEDIKELANFISDFLLDNKITTRQVAAVLPDHRIFSKVISLPNLKGKEFQQALEWEAEQHLPQSLNEVYLKYTIVSKHNPQKKGILSKVKQREDKDKDSEIIDILLVASPKNMVNKYVNVLNKAGLEPIGLEPASIALVRSTTSKDNPVPTMVVNFGYNKVSFLLVSDNNLKFVRTVNFAISTVNKAIAQELDISLSQANEYLYTYGLKESELSGKVRELIMPVVSIVIEELKKSIDFVEKRRNLIGGDDKRIKRVVLSGGGAMIPEILLYFVEMLGMEIEFADPWEHIDTSIEPNHDKLEKTGPLFAPSLGIALKHLK